MNQQHESYGTSVVVLDGQSTEEEHRGGTAEHPLDDRYEEAKTSREEDVQQKKKQKKDRKQSQNELEEDEDDVVNEIDTFLIEDDDL